MHIVLVTPWHQEFNLLSVTIERKNVMGPAGLFTLPSCAQFSSLSNCRNNFQKNVTMLKRETFVLGFAAEF